MEVELAELQKDTEEGPTWPAAVPPYSKPPNRYQVSKRFSSSTPSCKE